MNRELSARLYEVDDALCVEVVTRIVSVERFNIWFVSYFPDNIDNEDDYTCPECATEWPGEKLCDACGDPIGAGPLLAAYNRSSSLIARFHTYCLLGWQDYDCKGEVWRSKNASR